MEKKKIKEVWKEIVMVVVCILVTTILFAGGCIEETSWIKNAMFFLSGVACVVSFAGVMAILCELGITHGC